MPDPQPLVAVVMGSTSDWETMKHAVDVLEKFGVPQEHRDLDMAIDALESMVAGDQLQVQRLKKRKLALKDVIIRLEDQLTPDIIA